MWSIFEIIHQKMVAHHPVLLMFDYDGTLSPIAQKPEGAVLSTDLRQALETLAHHPFVQVAIVSGRRIDSVQAVSGLFGQAIHFIGLHGMEMLVAGEYRSQSTVMLKAKIAAIRRALSVRLKAETGVTLEDKGDSVAIHYRQVACTQRASRIERLVFTVFHHHNKNNQLKIQRGKKVLEIMPFGFNKASAIEGLMANFPTYYPVYCGDDLTDVEALERVLVLGGLAVGITGETGLFSDGYGVSTAVSMVVLKAVILALAG
jgi:trehalose 6-phosphate phosphatase